MFDIKYKLSQMPAMPGIYIMKDDKGNIIYVGKAKSLKDRVRQYFMNSGNLPAKTKVMVSLISDIETIITSTETEALILERNLIKLHKPKYNVLLKDDKNYPLIKITVKEEYPRIIMTRKVEDDGARYFGPYTSAYDIRETIESIGRIYPLKSCKKKFPRDFRKERPCMNYQIGRCLAPCQGNIDPMIYRRMIEDVCRFLSGNTDKIIREFEKEMNRHAEALDFEKAKMYRDRIQAVRIISNRQHISRVKAENGDFIACFGNEVKACIQMLFLRGREIIGKSTFFVDKPVEKGPDEIISGFITQYYDSKRIIPNKIYVQQITDDKESIEEYLYGIRNRAVKIIRPVKGEKKNIIDMALKNAMIEFQKVTEKLSEKTDQFNDLRKKLSSHLMMGDISRIEAFDVSNTSGNDIVAAMVVFDKDGFDKKSYRRFMIRSIDTADDYAAMNEAVRRRFRYLQDKNNGITEKPGTPGTLRVKPDAVFIDGAKGHVNTVIKALEELGIDIDVAGMVKNDKHRTKGVYYKDDYFDLVKEPELLRFITMIQDEAHRFALQYNRQKMKKRVLSSAIEGIQGIGEAKKKALLREFGSVKKIREADTEKLMSVPGISRALAMKIRKELESS